MNLLLDKLKRLIGDLHYDYTFEAFEWDRDRAVGAHSGLFEQLTADAVECDGAVGLQSASA